MKKDGLGILDFRLVWDHTVISAKKSQRFQPLQFFRLLDWVEINNPQSKIRNPKSEVTRLVSSIRVLFARQGRRG